MGIFERSIPKYIRNPMTNSVEVESQPYVVDDIFDPIFNARVKNALRQKYGNGLYATLGGYEEMLKNAWTGNEGFLGKGMGVLSTFGRSMEKADDVVLGLLTEGVEGVTGQGFDNPLKNIFVNDQDYTGKRLLASTANTFRNVVGAKVSEEDFGKAWNLPALGLELGTDVGILGSKLSRNLTPELHALRSDNTLKPRDVFSRLGKSGNFSTTLGEVGQIMSDYDDLMARVAIDATAPGLRPAFNVLRNKLASRVFGTHSSSPYVNVQMGIEDAMNGIDSDDPVVQKASEEFLQNLANSSEAQLISEIDRVLATLPEDKRAAFLQRNRTPSQIVTDVADNKDYYTFSHAAELAASLDNLDKNISAKASKIVSDEAARQADSLSKSFDDYDRALLDEIGKFVERAKAYGIDIDQIGIDRSARQANLDEATSQGLDVLRDEIMAKFLPGYGTDAIKSPSGAPYSVLQSDAALENWRSEIAERVKANRSKYFRPNGTPKKALRKYHKRLIDTRAEEIEAWRKKQLEAPKLKVSDESVPYKTAAEAVYNINKSYINELLDTLGSPDRILHAIETGDWTSNEATNKALDTFVGDARWKDSLWYKSWNPKISVSPSLYARASRPMGVKGLNYADLVFDKTRYKDKGLSKERFKTPEEFEDFMASDTMTAALNAVFPPVELSASERLRGVDFSKKFDIKDLEKLDSDSQIRHVSKFKELLKEVYFPTKTSVHDRVNSLHDLVEYIDKYAQFDPLKSTKTLGSNASLKFVEDAVISDLKFLKNIYKAADDVNQKYLQKLYNLPVQSLDYTGARAGRRVVSIDPATGRKLSSPISDTAQGLTEDYGNPEEYVKVLLSQAMPYIRSEEDLNDLIGDLRNFMQFKPKGFNSNYMRKVDVDSRAFSKSRKVVKDFYNGELELLEEYLAKGGNPFAKTPFKVKGFDDAKYAKLMAFVEKYPELVKDQIRYDKVTHPGIVTGFYDPSFKPKYDLNKYKQNLQDSKFKELKASGMSDSLAVEQSRKFAETAVAKMRSTGVTDNILTPDQLRNTPHLGGHLAESATWAKGAGENVNAALDMYSRAADNLASALPDIGIQDSEELSQLLSKAGVEYYGKNWKKFRSAMDSLSTIERRKVFAYSELYFKEIKNVPFHIVSRDPKLVSAEHGFPLLERTIKDLLSKGEIDDATASELSELLRLEQSAYAVKYNLPDAYVDFANDDLLEYLTLSKFESTAERDAVLSRFFNGSVSDFEAFLKDYQSAVREDARRIDAHRKQESAVREYALKRGKRYVAPKFDEYAARNAFLKNADVSNDPSTSAVVFEKYIDDYLTAESKDFEWALRRDELLNKVPKQYPYSVANVKYVKENLIDKLENKYAISWDPSAEKGLFNFNIGAGESAKAMYIGDSFDVSPGDLQLYYRTGKTKAHMKATKDKRFSSYINYSAIQSREGFENTARYLATRDLYMPMFSNDPQELTNTVSNILDAAKRTQIEHLPDAIETAYANVTPEVAAKTAYDAPSLAIISTEAVLNTLAPEMKAFKDAGGSDASGTKTFGKAKWDWFRTIDNAKAVRSRNSFRDQRATLREKTNAALGKRTKDFAARMVLEKKDHDFKEYIRVVHKQTGDVLKGNMFWDDFRKSGSYMTPFEDPKQLSVAKEALTKNAKLLNEAIGKEVVEVAEEKLSDDVTALIFRWNGNKKTVKYVYDNLSKIEKLAFEDVVFSPPTALSKNEMDFLNRSDMQEMRGLLDEIREAAQAQYTALGFKFDDSEVPFIKHAMRRDPEMAQWVADTFYKKMSSDDYDTVSNLISGFDKYRRKDKGAFGSTIQSRRFRGDFWLLDHGGHSLFEYAPDKIFTASLADGTFANLQYQSFVDLCINDNFKIKGIFNTVDDLKKVLYATDDKGRLSGNLVNSELVSYKTDATGRVIGLTKYDKTSDAGLAKALADENTILVPANAVSHIDNILKKDMRMNNKFWTFVNKHLTIPFKFGLLSNPGFLLGNVSDSILKLSTTMSQKYGTTMAKEAEQVAECINAAGALKNSYYTAFDEWKSVSAKYDMKLPPEATVADIVAMSPKYQEQFLKWLDGTLALTQTVKDPAGNLITLEQLVPCELPKEVIDDASIWTMLQRVQMNSNKMREYADLAGISKDSDFDVPLNTWDRITQGSGKYDSKKPSTWGVFMNNPYMKALSDGSGGWEDIIRTASILDDLRHGAYSKEDFAKYARGGMEGAEEGIKRSVRLDEAMNTMYNAQFDYERQSDFISKIGKTVPFPIFFLKNFQYWMELFADNPQYIDNVIDIQEGLWDGYNEDDEFMRDAKGRGAIPVGGDALPKWFKGVYKPSPMQSMFGAFSLLNNPIDDLSYRSHPLIGGAKALAVDTLPDSDLTTLLSDPESVKYRPYSTNMYERNIREGDPNFNPLTYTAHRMNPFDRTLNSYLRIPEKQKAGDLQLADALPSVFQPMF